MTTQKSFINLSHRQITAGFLTRLLQHNTRIDFLVNREIDKIFVSNFNAIDKNKTEIIKLLGEVARNDENYSAEIKDHYVLYPYVSEVSDKTKTILDQIHLNVMELRGSYKNLDFQSKYSKKPQAKLQAAVYILKKFHTHVKQKFKMLVEFLEVDCTEEDITNFRDIVVNEREYLAFAKRMLSFVNRIRSRSFKVELLNIIDQLWMQRFKDSVYRNISSLEQSLRYLITVVEYSHSEAQYSATLLSDLMKYGSEETEPESSPALESEASTEEFNRVVSEIKNKYAADFNSAQEVYNKAKGDLEEMKKLPKDKQRPIRKKVLAELRDCLMQIKSLLIRCRNDFKTLLSQPEYASFKTDIEQEIEKYDEEIQSAQTRLLLVEAEIGNDEDSFYDRYSNSETSTKSIFENGGTKHKFRSINKPLINEMTSNISEMIDEAEDLYAKVSSINDRFKDIDVAVAKTVKYLNMPKVLRYINISPLGGESRVEELKHLSESDVNATLRARTIMVTKLLKQIKQYINYLDIARTSFEKRELMVDLHVKEPFSEETPDE